MKAVPNCVGKDINDAIELANDSTELLELHKFLYEKEMILLNMLVIHFKIIHL